jgi:hypothetical protein
MSIPSAPDIVWPAVPGGRPTVSEVELPTKPDMVFPEAPEIERVVVGTAPEITIPAFDGEYPTTDLVAPDVSFSWSHPVYQSDLAEKLKSALGDALQNGGTGLGAEAEAALWERARARNAAKNEAMYREAEEYFESRGHDLPDGVVSGRLLQIQAEISQSENDLNNDIAVESARLAQEWAKIVVNATVGYEASLMEHHNRSAQLGFESAKYAQEAAVRVFEARVAKFQADLDRYKTAAAVYESRIRAALLELEKFKAELEGVKAVADVQRLYVEVYRSQVAALEGVQRLYAAEMEGARLKLEVDRYKIEAYREEIGAYTAAVNANTARYNAYEAQVRGEAVKADVWAKQVEAFVSETQAARSRGELEIAAAQAGIENNRMLTEKYRADIDMYRENVRAAVARLETLAGKYGADIEAYRAEIALAGSKIDADVKSYDVQARHEAAQLELALRQAAYNLESAIKQHELQVEALKAGATVSAQMAASAMSSVSAAAQMSFRGGYSNSYSYDKTKKEPTTHHQYIYNNS